MTIVRTCLPTQGLGVHLLEPVNERPARRSRYACNAVGRIWQLIHASHTHTNFITYTERVLALSTHPHTHRDRSEQPRVCWSYDSHYTIYVPLRGSPELSGQATTFLLYFQHRISVDPLKGRYFVPCTSCR